MVYHLIAFVLNAPEVLNSGFSIQLEWFILF